MYKNGGTGEVFFDDLRLIEYGEVPAPAAAIVPPDPVFTEGSTDEFNGATLNPQWNWIRESRANWSLSGKPGYMSIVSQSGDIVNGQATAKNILLTGAPEGDWTIETRMAGKPTSQWSQGGLIVYQSDQTYFRLTRLYGSGNQFQFSKQIEGVREHVEVPDTIDSTVSYLRIVKQGNTYSGYYSADGAAFTQLWTTQTADLTDPKIGLIVCAGTGLVADFDYFHIIKANAPAPAPVSGVTLDPAELNMSVGETAVLSATVAPSDAVNKTVTWSSDNPAVAQANPNGTVTATGLGTAVVTVTTADGSRTDQTVIQVLPPGAENIAPLAAVSASSSHENGSFPPAKAVDGVTNQDASRWITDTTLSAPHWFELEWDRHYEIDEVNVWSGFRSLTGRQIADFTIQYWDGSGWQTAATVTGNTQDGRTGQYNALTFPAVTTNKLRMHITKGSAYDQIARLFEIEVWGVESEVAVVPVSAIAVAGANGASSVTVGGTLQMTAAVEPVNATEKSVTWSVSDENGQATDKASIDAAGLLSAHGAGTVKAAAAANDGSGIVGELVVTIMPLPAPETQNLAPLAALTASSTNGAYTKDKAVDGVMNQNASRWITDSAAAGPHWLLLEWDRAYTIDRVKLWSGFLSWLGSQIADFQIQYWDGSGWQVAAAVTGNAQDYYYGMYNDLAFPAVTTDKLRLYITKGSKNDNIARLFEIEVWEQAPATEPAFVPVSSVAVAQEDESSPYVVESSAQMISSVQPENATNRSVTWSVVGEDGKPTDIASVDANGLLSAHRDGIVKVVAAANDGSGIVGERRVAIDTEPPVIAVPERLMFSLTEPIVLEFAADDKVSGVHALDIVFDGQAAPNPIAIDSLTKSAGEYPLLVTAVDRAGHRAEQSFVLSISIDIERLDDLIAFGVEQGWVGNDEIVNSLTAHVNNIQRDAGNEAKLANSIRSMEQSVRAQRGKPIEDRFADVILEALDSIRVAIGA
ncbi:Ig-like domain-containing protein [Paenibacillus harenae]|uniref:Ig-like domain-containing protein n=1 Tax=Paenibacillus harenae TaxID=306543 RepID=UPI00040A9DA4|nr:Ig-like domain-containing protein [Paenibacillus harenae]